MNYVITTIVETVLRFLPVPCKTGVTTIGNPDKNAPVFLTCNYHLTVERVKKALKNMDCYLLVANSRGVNVWCASTGGLLTNHDVISVLKTSGIEGVTDTRTVILPQLAAAGIEKKVVEKKTGWNVVWGPVHARDIPAFVNREEKPPKMREVTFSFSNRVEIASAWAFPASIIVGLFMTVFWRENVVSSVLLVWVLSLLMNGGFPVHENKHMLTKIFFLGIGRGGFQVITWVGCMAVISVYALVTGIPKLHVVGWSIISAVIILVLGFDLMGNTPVYKSSLHKDRLFTPVLDTDKCRGAGFCEDVCPRRCFTVDRKTHTALLEPGSCVQCGACIVQCSFDAVHFENPEGDIVSPETIRKYKLNLMGSRLTKAGT
jgi:NAD-dependent dihydropyrimidine dehydrogenase PreA subunit